MNTEQLRAEIIRLGPWHHDVEVEGLRTGELTRSGVYAPELGKPTVIVPQEHMTQLVGEMYGGDLGGRSFLDCGCNGGGYLFAAARHGAGRSFGFDAREHWIRQARFLAQHLPSENIRFEVRELAQLPELGLEPFDITIFNGLFYHLPDPMTGLRMAADLTKELLVVNTAWTPSKSDALILNRESTVEVMSGVNGLAWLPGSVRVMREILRWCGFPYARLRFNRKTADHRHRMEIMAARDESTFRHYDSLPRPRSPWYRRVARRVLRRR